MSDTSLYQHDMTRTTSPGLKELCDAYSLARREYYFDRLLFSLFINGFFYYLYTCVFFYLYCIVYFSFSSYIVLYSYEIETCTLHMYENTIQYIHATLTSSSGCICWSGHDVTTYLCLHPWAVFYWLVSYFLSKCSYIWICICICTFNVDILDIDIHL